MITELAQAVVVALNAETFALDFMAKRIVLPQTKLEDLDGLTVSVVPRSDELTSLTRGLTAHEMKIDIAIQQRVSAVDNTTIDPLIALAEEVRTFLNRQRIGDGIWKRTQHEPIYLPDHLRQLRTFTSVITVTYIETQS